MTDSEIQQSIERVRSGSIDDYRTIVAAYHQRLRGALAGLCPPGVDVNEIAHLSFIEAYRNLSRYESGTNFFAWLCAIARCRLLAEAKRAQRQAHNKQKYLEHLVTERMILLAQNQSQVTEDRLRLLRECIAQLKPESRAILDQRYAQGAPIESLARALGRSASAVRVQLFALRQKLRDCIERKLRESHALVR